MMMRWSPLAAVAVAIQSALACGGEVASDDAGWDATTDAILIADAPSEIGLVDGTGDTATPDAAEGGADASSDAPVDVDAAPVLTALLSSAGLLLELVIDSTSVYVDDYNGGSGGRVLKCAKAGCGGTPTVIASNQLSLLGLAIDTTNLYWLNNQPQGTAFECALTGCAPDAGPGPVTLASGQANPNEIATDGISAYWTDYASGTVVRCAVGGCGGSATVIASSQNNPMGIAVDATNVYWTNTTGGSVMELPKNADAGVPIPLASGLIQPYFISTDGTDVYWTGNGKVMKCAVAGCGGNPTTLASSTGSPLGIAVDNTNVYWTNITNGTILKCGKGGCGSNPTVIASGQSSPYGIAVDSTSVYWSNESNGGVMKLTPK